MGVKREGIFSTDHPNLSTNKWNCRNSKKIHLLRFRKY